MAYSTRGFMGLLISINLSSFYRTLHIPAGITQVVGRALPLHEGVVGVNVFGDAVHDGVGLRSMKVRNFVERGRGKMRYEFFRDMAG